MRFRVEHLSGPVVSPLRFSSILPLLPLAVIGRVKNLILLVHLHVHFGVLADF